MDRYGCKIYAPPEYLDLNYQIHPIQLGWIELKLLEKL